MEVWRHLAGMLVILTSSDLLAACNPHIDVLPESQQSGKGWRRAESKLNLRLISRSMSLMISGFQLHFVIVRMTL